MTQVSRFPLEEDVYYQIRDDFLWTISSHHSQDQAKAFFYDFFTKTERLMLAKRFAVALLIYENFDYRDIQYLLHVSSATISREAQWLDKEGNGIKPILEKLKQEERIKAFLKKADRFIDRHIANPWKLVR